MTKQRKEIDAKMIKIIKQVQKETKKKKGKKITFPIASKMVADKISGEFLK